MTVPVLVANGGTGVTTSTGSGANVLGTSPTLVTPLLGTPTSVTLTNATGLPLTTGITGVLAIANGGTNGTTPATGRAGIGATGKFTATIGDGATTAIVVTHNLGSADVISQVRDATTNVIVEPDMTQSSATQTTFTFVVAPAAGAYKVVIIG